jgi:hypothetical protein
MLMTFRKCMVVALLGFFCVTGFSSGAVADGAPSAKPKSKGDRSDSGDPPLRVYRRLRVFMNLERAILSGVKLDASQRSEVKKRFAALYRQMKDDPRKASFFPEAYSTYSDTELKSRRADLAAARKAKNGKLEREILADIDKHTVGHESNLTPGVAGIIDDLSPLMKGNQLSAYKRIVDRWSKLTPTGPFNGPFRMLFRAIQDPELKLSKEQEKPVYRLLNEANAEVRADRDPASVAKVSASLRAKIMKILKTDQRTHFDRTLRELAQEYKAVKTYAHKWFGSRGIAVPKHYSYPVPWEE